MGTWLGFAALAVVGGTGFIWYRWLSAVRVEGKRGLALAGFGLGATLGVAAFAVGTPWPGGLAAGLATALGGGFLALQPLSRQRQTLPGGGLGSEAPEIEAVDAAGEPFSLSAQRGHPVLLKFFRGHW